MVNASRTTLELMEEEGFEEVRILSPYRPELPSFAAPETRSLAIGALPYGNQLEKEEPPPGFGAIAPFARRNYYREAVKRLQKIAVKLRSQLGGQRGDFRILCNSPIPEKPLAKEAGMGLPGRNGLIITPNLGSLFIIAAIALPYELEGAQGGLRNPCEGCERKNPPCMAACPTGALVGDGTMDRKKCIQWYASGHEEEVPENVAAKWGRRLYGCADCQDACIHNRPAIPGAETELGKLPPFMDCRELLKLDDGEIKARFKGTAMGLSWLGPGSIKRNAALALQG